jgi:hypothetical protein
MREVGVVGGGMINFGGSHNTEHQMFPEAWMDALAESNLEPKNTVVLLPNNEVVGHAEGKIAIAPRPTTEIDFPSGRGTLCPRILQKLECYGPSASEKA